MAPRSGVFFDCLVDCTASPIEVLGYHDRVNLDAGIEREEPRFRDGRDMRSILHLDKNEPRALAIVVRKINRLRLQICQNGLDRRAELSGLRSRVPGPVSYTH